MFIDFYKKSEDENSVVYLIETKSYEQTSSGVLMTPVKGLCSFDKNTKTISFESPCFESPCTDRYFFDRVHEPLMIEAHLKKIDKKQKGFPEEYYIATGG